MRLIKFPVLVNGYLFSLNSQWLLFKFTRNKIDAYKYNAFMKEIYDREHSRIDKYT